MERRTKVVINTSNIFTSQSCLSHILCVVHHYPVPSQVSRMQLSWPEMTTGHREGLNVELWHNESQGLPATSHPCGLGKWGPVHTFCFYSIFEAETRLMSHVLVVSLSVYHSNRTMHCYLSLSYRDGHTVWTYNKVYKNIFKTPRTR